MILHSVLGHLSNFLRKTIYIFKLLISSIFNPERKFSKDVIEFSFLNKP